MAKSVFKRRGGGFGFCYPESDPSDGEDGLIIIGHDTDDKVGHRYYDRRAHNEIPTEHVVAMMHAPEVEPISVVRHPEHDGLFIVRKGRHRTKTMRLVNEILRGRGEEPRRLRTVLTSGKDPNAAIAIAQENLCRRDTNAIEELGYITSIRDDGWNVDEIAERLAKSTSWVRNRLTLENADPVLVDAIENDRIKVSAAFVIARKSRDKQRELVENALARADAAGKRTAKGTNVNGDAGRVGSHRPGIKVCKQLAKDDRLPQAVRDFLGWWVDGEDLDEVPGLKEALEAVKAPVEPK